MGYVVVFDGFEHSTAWLMGVGAVAEAALLGELEDFLEIAGEFLALHIKGAEALDAWSVDEPSVIISGITVDHRMSCEGNHF